MNKNLILAFSVAHLLFTGLVAGALLMDRVTASPVRPTMSAEAFIHFQQAVHVKAVVLMPILMVGSIVSGVALLWFTRTLPGAAKRLRLASLLMVIGVLVLTRVVNVPINDLLMTWNPQVPPTDLREIWARWEWSHSIRTPVAVLGFLCASVAAVIDQKS